VLLLGTTLGYSRGQRRAGEARSGPSDDRQKSARPAPSRAWRLPRRACPWLAASGVPGRLRGGVRRLALLARPPGCAAERGTSGRGEQPRGRRSEDRAAGDTSRLHEIARDCTRTGRRGDTSRQATRLPRAERRDAEQYRCCCVPRGCKMQGAAGEGAGGAGDGGVRDGSSGQRAGRRCVPSGWRGACAGVNGSVKTARLASGK